MNLRFEVMKRVLFISLMMFMGCGAQQALRVQAQANPDEKQSAQPRKRGGIFTMYALDPLARSLCFADGKEGFAIISNDWGNRCSDLKIGRASCRERV